MPVSQKLATSPPLQLLSPVSLPNFKLTMSKSKKKKKRKEPNLVKLSHTFASKLLHGQEWLKKCIQEIRGGGGRLEINAVTAKEKVHSVGRNN